MKVPLVYNILVAEDDPEIHSIVQQMIEFHFEFRNAFCEITVAETGQDALNQSLEKEFDLIILDLQFPDMHGNDVLKALDTKGSNVTTPKIILSGEISNHNWSTQDTVLYSAKPITLKRLTFLIDSYVIYRKEGAASIKKENSYHSPNVLIVDSSQQGALQKKLSLQDNFSCNQICIAKSEDEAISMLSLADFDTLFLEANTVKDLDSFKSKVGPTLTPNTKIDHYLDEFDLSNLNDEVKAS